MKLAPAVHILTVPSLLCPELLLAGPVLDVGASQPGRRPRADLPAHRQAVELCRLVRQELLPALEQQHQIAVDQTLKVIIYVPGLMLMI